MCTANENIVKTVTIVDDNAILRVVFSNMIKSFTDFPIKLNLFENALDALDYFESQEKAGLQFTDVLFVDINMPFMTGWEMMDQLESYNLDELTNVYILSSSTNKADQDMIIQYPMIKGYLSKPMLKEDLYEILKNIA